jgi:hypothetical protein
MAVGDKRRRRPAESSLRPHQYGLRLSDEENELITRAAGDRKVTAFLVETGLAAARGRLVDVSDVDGVLAGFDIRDKDGYPELVCVKCRLSSKERRLGEVCEVDDGDSMDTLVRMCLDHEHEECWKCGGTGRVEYDETAPGTGPCDECQET